jgi:hypothetical protein
VSDREEARDHEEARDREEYAGWTRPGADGAPAGSDEQPPEDRDDEDWVEPSTVREPLLRDRLRERFGVSPRRWYVIESFLLAAPYVVFVALYIAFDLPEVPFLVVTLLYSLVAIYVGILP